MQLASMNSAGPQSASAASQRLAAAQAIRDAARQCQTERNAAWLEVTLLLVPYTRDVDERVQKGAFELLAGVLKRGLLCGQSRATALLARTALSRTRVRVILSASQPSGRLLACTNLGQPAALPPE